MKISKVEILTTIVIIESILVVLLVTAIGHGGVKAVIKSTPATVSPLETALEYEAPDHVFEKLVKEHPIWIKYRLKLPDKTLSPPILADCAILNRTNYVRILIANGADVEVAVSSLNDVGAAAAVKLLRQVQSEFPSQK